MSITEDLVTLNSAMTQLMRRIRRVDDRQGIGRARLSALAVLHFGGECSLSELADAEMVSRATMHHIVKGLEGDGLIRREQDPKDFRRQVLKLTRAGSRAIIGAHAARLAYWKSLTAGIRAEELAAVAAALDLMRKNAATDLT